MTPRSSSRETAISNIATYIKSNGLSNTGLRTLAEAVGTSDRMLLYYFKDKADIMDTVLQHLADQFEETLSDIVPMGMRHPPESIFIKVADIAQTHALKPYMALRLELAAQSQSTEGPYTDITQKITDNFTTWIDDRLQVANMDARRSLAIMLLAMIDGLFQASHYMDEPTFTKTKNSMALALRGMG